MQNNAFNQSFLEQLIQTAETAAAVVDSQGQISETGREAYLDHGVVVRVDDDATNVIRISVVDDGVVFDATAYFDVLSVKVFQSGRWQSLLEEMLDAFPPRQLSTFQQPSELSRVIFDKDSRDG